MSSQLNIRFISPIGQINLFHGPMFAAKTTRAVGMATMMSEHNRVLFVNWADDVRETPGGEAGKYTSHNPSNIKLCDRVTCVSTRVLADVSVHDFQVIFVDECHFYPDLYKTVKRWAYKLNKHVYVFGLDGDYRQKPIGQTLSLIPIASSSEKLFAQCTICVSQLRDMGYEGCIESCPAPFTTATREMNTQFSVGASERYIPVCHRHAIELKHKPKDD